MDRVIEAHNLSKTFGEVTAVKDLSLEINSGELYGFLGPNGAGKTTSIGMLTGQLTPDSGDITVLGTNPVTDPVSTRATVGILPERESPPSHLTPREFFEFVGESRGLTEDTIQDRIDEWTSRFAFEDQLDTIHTDLSQGQKQKVMITQAFLHEPELVFIDEPLSNLDPIMQERAKTYFEQYRDNGNTVFLSTHNIDVAEDICTTVGIVTEGVLQQERNPQELSESLLDTFLADVGEQPE